MWKFTGLKFSEMLFCLSNSIWQTTPKFKNQSFYLLMILQSGLGSYWWAVLEASHLELPRSWAQLRIWVAGVFLLSPCSLRTSPNGVFYRVDRLFTWQFMVPNNAKVEAARLPEGIGSELAQRNLFCILLFKASHRPSSASRWGLRKDVDTEWHGWGSPHNRLPQMPGSK